MVNNTESRQHFDAAVAAFVENNFNGAIDGFLKAIELNPDDYLAHVSLGAALTRAGRAEESFAHFDKALEINPKYARAHHLRGLSHETVGNRQEALEDFNRAIELEPEYGAAYYSRANLHSKTGNDDLAAEDMATVTALTEINVSSYANENNVWRSQQLRLESMGVADVMDR